MRNIADKSCTEN